MKARDSHRSRAHARGARRGAASSRRLDGDRTCGWGVGRDPSADGGNRRDAAQQLAERIPESVVRRPRIGLVAGAPEPAP